MGHDSDRDAPDRPSEETLNRRREFIVGLNQQLLTLPGGSMATIPPTSLWPRPWWWRDEDGRVLLRLRFRGVVLKVNGDADTAVLSSLTEATELLRRIRLAVADGRLDRQLAAVDI
jgi:hypothetical protein